MPENCAAKFMTAFFERQPTDMACVDELCGLALSDESQKAAAGVQALYGSLIEALCDDFSDRGLDLGNQVLLRILFTLLARGRLPAIEKLLSQTGFFDSLSLLQRHAELRRWSMEAVERPPKTIIVLSRVTIGADILITSIIVQRLRKAFPEANIVLFGPAHLSDLFSEQTWLSNRLIPYERNCPLVDRIAISAKVHAAILEQSRLGGEQPIMLVDPDSRLSQLGLMPLLPMQQCRYFCSRQQKGASEDSSLIHLCNHWLDQWLGYGEEVVYPRVFIGQAPRRMAADFMQRLRRHKKWVLVVNLGVGKDERKRVGDGFEELLLLEMLKRPQLLVVLDSGSSPAGRKRVERLMGKAREGGFGTIFIDERELSAGMPASINHHLVGIRSSIGLISALIAEADCFFGYDSCCQHLAAASCTPGVEVFAGHPSKRFLNRWRPLNRRNSIEVLSYRRNGERHLQDEVKLVEEVAQAIDRRISLAGSK